MYEHVHVWDRDAACVLDWEAAYSGVICVQALTATFTRLVTLGKLLGLSMHQFLHLKIMDVNNNDTYYLELLWTLKELKPAYKAPTTLSGI